MDSKPVLIISHERSGTHFLINTIGLNYPRFREGWADVTQNQHESVVAQYFCQKRENIIIKSHHQFYSFRECWNSVKKSNHCFYVVRDGKDVLVSWYYHCIKMRFVKKDLTFSQFIRSKLPEMREYWYDRKTSKNMIERWKTHVESWIDKDINIIRYRDLLLDFENTLLKIAFTLYEVPQSQIKPELKVHHSINPRKGSTGDWQNHFTEDDLKLYYDITGDLNKKLGFDN